MAGIFPFPWKHSAKQSLGEVRGCGQSYCERRGAQFLWLLGAGTEEASTEFFPEYGPFSKGKLVWLLDRSVS